jgi:hypothetical protein
MRCATNAVHVRIDEIPSRSGLETSVELGTTIDAATSIGSSCATSTSSASMSPSAGVSSTSSTPASPSGVALFSRSVGSKPPGTDDHCERCQHVIEECDARRIEDGDLDGLALGGLDDAVVAVVLQHAPQCVEARRVGRGDAQRPRPRDTAGAHGEVTGDRPLIDAADRLQLAQRLERSRLEAQRGRRPRVPGA